MNTAPVEFVTAAEAEGADIIVCLHWSDPPILPDNVRTSCSSCGEALQHRPDAPKRPKRLCMPCALVLTVPAQGRA